MSALASRVDDYLTLRRASGYRLDAHGRVLPQFVSDLDGVGVSTVTVETALDWAVSSTTDGQARTRLSIVRGFARYLQAFDPAVPVPPTNLLPDLRGRPAPYLYSGAEITALLAAAARLHPALRAATYHTLFGLVAATGMRGGEAVKLERDDVNVDLDAGLLAIRNSKFNKSRELVLYPSTVTALGDYQRVRARLCPRPQTTSFFVSAAGTNLSGDGMRTVFRQLVNQVGLQPRSGSRPPWIHDLRHSFAVTTLIEWYRDGADVAARMPLLSAYLGHSKPASTYWNLQAAPELLGLAAGRLESPLRARR